MKLTILHALALVAHSRAFELIREYAGDSFFDRWAFYGFWDNLTSGDVNYLDQPDAFSNQLVSTTASGNTIIRVDNFTNVPFNYKRNSIRITSNDSYDFGSIWVFDVVHLPFGCSVWPSIWTHAANWPIGGEIDIVEGINLQQYNQIALHTLDGCMQTANVTQTGFNGGLNCSTPSGCTVQDPSKASYGAAFAQSGGGVWATQFDVSGIYIWFWTRASVPASLAARDTLDISAWGTPVAVYPSGACNMTEFFGPQQLVIDITLCGVWAGVPSIYNSTCAGMGATGMCYNDNVIGPGAPRYDDAYFEIAHVRTYTTAAAPAPTTSMATAARKSSARRRAARVGLSLAGLVGMVAAILW